MIAGGNSSTLKGWPWTEHVDASVYDTNVQWPKISVLTPSFNQGDFIEETILSVLNQHYPNLEYIIIDGGSTDHTVSIIQKYESHISYWVSEPDTGQTNALNKGLSRANGEILFWINSDDYFEPQAFYKVVSEFLKDPSLQVVCGRLTIIGDSVPRTTYTIVTEDVLERVVTMNRFQQPPTIFKLDVFKSIGLLDEQYQFIMDLELWINYLSQYGLKHIAEIPDVIATFRLHDVSKSSSQAIRFEHERDELYIGLIRKEDPVLYAQLAQLLHFGERSVERLLKRITDHKLMDPAIIVQYYVLLRTMEVYETGNKRLARQLASLIQRDKLQPKDQVLLRKLMFKILMVPYFLKKAIQKMRSRT